MTGITNLHYLLSPTSYLLPPTFSSSRPPCHPSDYDSLVSFWSRTDRDDSSQRTDRQISPNSSEYLGALAHPNSDDRESRGYHSRSQHSTNYDNREAGSTGYHDRVRHLPLDAGRGYITESPRRGEEYGSGFYSGEAR